MAATGVALSCATPACGGSTRGDGGGEGGAGSTSGAGGQGGSSGGADSGPCSPGSTTACPCPGYAGVQFCKSEGVFAACICTGGPGAPPDCTVGPNCGGCADDLSDCVCETGDPNACIEGCGALCSGGYFADSLSCNACPHRVPPLQVCFHDAEKACAFACSAKTGGTCKSTPECPSAVTCS